MDWRIHFVLPPCSDVYPLFFCLAGELCRVAGEVAVLLCNLHHDPPHTIPVICTCESKKKECPSRKLCWQIAFFPQWLRSFPLSIHGTAQGLELLLGWKFVASTGAAYVLVHHRLAGLGVMSHLLASSIRSRTVCSIFRLSVT